MFRLIGLAMVAMAFLAFAPTPSEAQISNRPYSFKNVGPNGVGMSNAGRQAIINQELYGSTPDALLKGPDGNLLTLEKGPNGLAIVFGPDGQPLPTYRGRSWKGGDPSLKVGVFNAYFVPRPHNDYGPYLPAAATSGEAVDAWTGAVLYDAPPRYGNSLDQWVAMALYLGPRPR